MKWASHATKQVWEAGQSAAIVVPYPKLAKIIRPKGGNTAVVMAGAGVGKTTFLLNWVVRSGMRVLYISSDTSPHDLTSQLAAITTSDLRRDVEERLMTSDSWRKQYAEEIFKQFPDLVVDFSPRPSMQSIRDMVGALTELWGQPPQMVVMDTASNVDMADMGSNAEWQRVWLESIGIARDFELFFVFAHHLRQGMARSGTQAPVLSDGLWGSDQFPEICIGLHKPRPHEMVGTVLKNRTGPNNVPFQLAVDFARSIVEEAT